MMIRDPKPYLKTFIDKINNVSLCCNVLKRFETFSFFWLFCKEYLQLSTIASILAILRDDSLIIIWILFMVNTLKYLVSSANGEIVFDSEYNFIPNSICWFPVWAFVTTKEDGLLMVLFNKVGEA